MENLMEQIFVFVDNSFLYFISLIVASFVNAFFPPIPVELIALFGGYLVSLGHGSLWVVIVATFIGMTAGSSIVHILAKRWGKQIMNKPLFGGERHQHLYQRAIRLFKRFGVWSLFLSKFVPGMSFATVVGSGFLHLDTRTAITAIAGSNVMIFTILAFLGKIAGDQWEEAYALLKRISLFTVVILFLVIGGLVLYLELRKRFKKK